MRTLTTAAANRIASGRYGWRRMFKFEIGPGYAYWDGAEPYACVAGTGIDDLAAGITYQPGGHILDLMLQPAALDGSAGGFSLTLDARNDPRLSGNVLSSLETAPYHRKRGVVSVMILDPDSLAVDQVMVIGVGYAGAARRKQTFRADGQIEREWIEWPFYSRMQDWQGPGAHDATDDSQKDTYSGDRVFENVMEPSRRKNWAEGVTA